MITPVVFGFLFAPEGNYDSWVNEFTCQAKLPADDMYSPFGNWSCFIKFNGKNKLSTLKLYHSEIIDYNKILPRQTIFLFRGIKHIGEFCVFRVKTYNCKICY